MKCPKCSTDLAPNAYMCTKCGAMVAGVEFEKRPIPSERPKTAYAIGGTLLAVILIALILKLALSSHESVTQGGGTPIQNGPSVTNAPSPGMGLGPSITNAPSPGAPPGGPAVGAPGRMATQEDLDYLEFVRKIEEQRRALLADKAPLLSVVTGLANTMTGAGSIETLLDQLDVNAPETQPTTNSSMVQARKSFDTYTAKWTMLIRQFDSVRAPSSCAEFAGYYRAVLAAQVIPVTRLQMIVNGMNPEAREGRDQARAQVEQMKTLLVDHSLQQNIDTSVDNSDAKLAELSTRLGIKKPFDVMKETSTGGWLLGP